MSELDLKLNIRWLRFFNIAISLIFLAPVFILFLQEKFTLGDAIFLQMLFVISMGVFEVPAGVFADIYGKKRSLVLGASILSVSVFIYGVIDSFFAFAIVEVVLGVGYSLISGTVSSMLYESMKSLGIEDEYKKEYGKITQYSLFAVAFASILGSIIAKVGYEWTFYATSITSFIAMLFALKLKEPKVKVNKSKNHIRAAFNELMISNRELRYVVIISVIIAVFNQLLFNTYQPYFKLIGIDIAYFGLIFASFQILAAFSSRFAHKLESKLGFLPLLWLLFGLTVLSIFLIGNFVYIFSFIFIYLQQFVRGVRPVVVSAYMNKNISSKYRTTVASIESVLYRLSYMPLMFVLSKLTDNYKLTVAINIVAFIALSFGVIAIIGSLISKKRREDVLY